MVTHENLPQNSVVVYLVSENNTTIINYTSTNEKGLFEFTIPNNSNYFLQVKSLRFDTTTVKILNEKSFYEIQVNEKQSYKTKTLEEVVIKKELLVKKTGDSIKYKAKDFISKADRTLEDLIKNIPGLEVDSEGVISYQGKKVTNFYIEGDDFLSKIYRTATQNLNVDMIDEIQILEKNQHIKMLQGKIESKNTGLNIVLKDDFKGKWVYNLEFGTGYKNLYKINPMATFFNKKFKSINFVKANNVGEDLSTMFGTTNFNDLLTDLEINFSNSQLSITNTNLPNLTKKRFNNNAVAFTSNMSYVFNKNYDLQSNFVYYYDYNINEAINRTQFNSSQLSIGFTESNKFNARGNYYSQLFKLRKNSNENYFTNDLKLQFYTENNNSLLTNSSQTLKNNYFELKNTLKTIKAYKQVFFDFNLLFNFGYLKDGLNITPGIFQNKLNANVDYNLTKQNLSNKIIFFKNSLDSRFKYNDFKFSLGLENILSNRDNNSDLSLIQANGDLNLLNEYSNQNNLLYNKTAMNSLIEFNLNRFQLNLEYRPLLFNFMNTNQKDVYAKDFKFVVLKKIGRENELSLNYTFDDVPTNIMNVYEQFYLRNFRTFTRNQLPFLQADKNQIFIRLKLQRTTKLLFSETSISKTFHDLNYIVSNSFNTIQNTFEYIEFKNKRTVFSFNTNISKYIFDLKTNVKVSYNFNEVNQSQLNNFILLPFNNEVHSLKFNLNPKFSSIIGFSSEYGIIYNFNTNKNNNFKTKVIIQNSQNNFDVSFSESLNLRVSNEIIIYKNISKNVNHFLDAFINYKKQGSKFEYLLKWNNILNKKTYILESNSDFFTNTNQFLLRPTNILFSIIYKP